MAKKPVTYNRKKIAKDYGLANVQPAALACRRVGIPFYVACALLEKESGGRNVYGHDPGGVFSRDEHPWVDAQNFLRFLSRVVLKGEISNGVGPCQITYAGALKDGRRDGGFFRLMFDEGLRPWIPYDNMVFGFGLLKRQHEDTGSWRLAGQRYNGSGTKAEQYGADFERKVAEWKRRLRA